jgi:hypothetical protein
MSKICIWCLEEEPKAKFIRKAHIFPDNLGGKRICESVCDSCNSYFGNKQPKMPSIEIALKEPLNISRWIILSNSKQPSNERFKSEYFKYDLKKQIIKLKYSYRLISDFQTSFARQFRRGVYKIFLEERSKSIGDALDPKYNFIRHFARNGIGDYPVFYLRPNIPAVAISKEDTEDPLIRFTEHSEEIIKQYGFFSYYFITHLLAFPVISNYDITLENYISYLYRNEKEFDKIIPIKYMSDLDFTFSFAFGNKK